MLIFIFSNHVLCMPYIWFPFTVLSNSLCLHFSCLISYILFSFNLLLAQILLFLWLIFLLPFTNSFSSILWLIYHCASYCGYQVCYDIFGLSIIPSNIKFNRAERIKTFYFTPLSMLEFDTSLSYLLNTFKLGSWIISGILSICSYFINWRLFTVAA